MSANSVNRRRILSLWLPRLPIDRIKRKLAQDIASQVETHEVDEPSGEVSALAGLSPPLRGRVGERGSHTHRPSGLPLSLALPRKGGGNPTANASPTNGLSGDLPSVVVAKDHNAILLHAIDEAAVRAGLSIGLPLANARAICPELTVYDADPAADLKTLNDIADWCDRFTPLVALDPPYGLFLDITGCAHLFGGERALLQIVTNALSRRGFAVSAAIAGTSIAARTLTRYASGQIIADGAEAEAVGPLPVSALGADAAVTTGLRRAGLKTIGDVASRAPHEISARFGADFTTLLGHALGRGDAPISPRKPLPDYIVEKRFPEPIATDTVIALTLSSLAKTLVAAMEKQGKGARQLEASFFRTDGKVAAIMVETGRPVTRPEMIDRLFRERFDALNDPLDPGFGFDLIRLAAGRTEIVVQQQRDLDTTVHDNDEISALIDRIAARIGGKRVVVHLPLESHIPERSALALPAQHHLAAASAAAWPERVIGEPPLRPLRLFERPEPIKVPFASVPDGPPHQFTWRRALHAVVRVEGPERIAMEWWKQDGAALTRDYFRVEDAEGQRFWIFRDGLYESELRDEQGKPVPANWYVHGLFA
ncbi:DNA polymerase Y family protein [Bradyrhizobium sp. Pha-3]|uniref:Y-family DNA polymerase n=1 Tax=Bradyrhizobium sp. Pha-3 TaxID=208375 RepID=UPI0035D5275B